MKKYIVFSILMAGVMFSLVSFEMEEPLTRADLGKLLFFDPILSKDKTISCATCHNPEFAFADSSTLSKGVYGRLGTRNTPSAMNVSMQQAFFWDGRAGSLEEQALRPIANPAEMDLPIQEAVNRLRKDNAYKTYFQKIYGSQPNDSTLADAIAAFERTLETFDSPFDNWKFYDRLDAVSESAKRGFILFSEKGKCTQCHFGADFTAREFRNIGLFNGKELNDSGRTSITGNLSDLGKFKTPGLRNIAVTAPYMHNGMFKTLIEVVDFYNDPAKVVSDAINRDSILAKPLGLKDAEKWDLVAFLLTLTDRRFEKPFNYGY